MKKLALICLIGFTFFTTLCFAQETTANAGMTVPENRIRSSNEGFASEEFRRGVQAYYKGAFNEAIVQFEKALSYMPNDNLILDWLGKSYYKSGLEGSALSYWETAAGNGYGGLLLENKIEIVKERRVTGDSQGKLMRLSESGTFNGELNGNLIFSGPVSVLSNPDGSIWVVAYNSNELLLINQNGTVMDRITGPLNGFDRPMDIIRLRDGNLLVSESEGDRLALLNKNGHFIKYIGEKGRGTGQMIGPLYLAQDIYERCYVTDYGNRRVDVFDKEGKGLFSFGEKNSDFTGLKGPTGIAAIGDSIFVADDVYGCIFEFDRAGNFVRQLVENDTLKNPEGLKKWNDSLVVCDRNQILSVNIDTGALFEYVRTGNAPSRVTTATPDINGNLVATDFTTNEVYVMSKVQELVGGLFLQIEQIDASKFPNITLEVRVENRHRQPMVGLELQNFYFTENKRPVTNLTLVGAASNNTNADITIIIDRSVSTSKNKTEIETAVREIAASMSGRGTLKIVTAGKMPLTEYQGNPDLCRLFSLDAVKNPVCDEPAIDLAIRLASNDLINAEKKRSIILISDGKTGYSSFAKYNLAQLTSYLANNSIGFSFVQVTQEALSDNLAYILDNTHGETYYVYRPEGLSNIFNDIIEIPQGIYQLKYTSSLQKNFGERFLPVEAEVYIHNRSGRDESGYFAPLD